MKKEIWKKYKKSICVTSVFVLLGLIILLRPYWDPVLSENSEIVRAEPGDGTSDNAFQVEIPELEVDTDYSVKVSERELNAAEREELFEKAQKEAETSFLGNNVSVDQITEPVRLTESFADGMVQAKWEFDDYEVVNADGTINEEKISVDGNVVTATVQFKYAGYAYLYSFPFRVCKAQKSETERILALIQEKIDGQNPEAETLKLPTQVDNYQIFWREHLQWDGLILIMLGVVAGILLAGTDRRNEREKAKKRKESLVRDYPEVIGKLTLLMGAGMTASVAWRRITEGYERQYEKGLTRKREVYVEMIQTLRDIEDGTAERVAYEKFANRCGLPQYKKMASLMNQNLKKGAGSTIEQLDYEAREAFEMRKSLAKKYGEEAGTKLLGPMMMMLAIVIVILMFPAFLSMKI